ncbi:MAG: FAD-dependent oxidoreductase [Candidatus Omnitrophota bacterium]
MKQFVIIGNSAAGISAAEAIRKKDKESKIIMISDEDYPAYCRCLISYYLAGEAKEENILYRPQDFYKENNIEILLNKKVSRIDPKKNRLICEDKTQISYDSLLIATGASPKFPETKGIKKAGVFGFRTIKDAKDISGLVPVTKSACVLGGGLIGLKAAYALKKRNIDVKVVIKSNQVLSQMLDSKSASFVQKKLEQNGIDFVFGQDVAEIIGEGEIKAVKFDSGKVYGCSLIIVGKGVEPNTGIVKDTEIKVNEGVIANNLLQTNVPNIYAAGDVCESFDLTLGKQAINALWPVAVEQGKAAAENMSGTEPVNYQGSVGMNSIEFFGLPVVSLGVYKIKDSDASIEELQASDEKDGTYKKIILKNDCIIGAILVGNINNSGIFLRLIRDRVKVSGIKHKLLDVNLSYADILELVKDTEQIYI